MSFLLKVALLYLSSQPVLAAPPTSRSNLCEGVSDFAIKANTKVNLVVFYNQKNEMLSLFECEIESPYCRSMYYGTKTNYCKLEIAHRNNSLKHMGLMRVGNDAYSIATGSLISQALQAKSLVNNTTDLFSDKKTRSCYDLNSLLTVLNGSNWQNVAANLNLDHLKFLQLTSFSQNAPGISSAVSLINLVERNPNSGLLSESVLSRRQPNRSLHSAVTSSTQGNNIQVNQNSNAKMNICEAMTSAPASRQANPSRISPIKRSRIAE